MDIKAFGYGVLIALFFIGGVLFLYRDKAQADDTVIEVEIASDGVLQCATIRGERGGFIGGVSCNWSKYNKDIKELNKHIDG